MITRLVTPWENATDAMDANTVRMRAALAMESVAVLPKGGFQNENAAVYTQQGDPFRSHSSTLFTTFSDVHTSRCQHFF